MEKIIKDVELVKIFNDKWKVGDKLHWKPSKNSEPIPVTVRGEAYLSHGNAVVFFNETSGFCSINPMFLNYYQ